MTATATVFLLLAAASAATSEPTPRVVFDAALPEVGANPSAAGAATGHCSSALDSLAATFVCGDHVAGAAVTWLDILVPNWPLCRKTGDSGLLVDRDGAIHLELSKRSASRQVLVRGGAIFEAAFDDHSDLIEVIRVDTSGKEVVAQMPCLGSEICELLGTDHWSSSARIELVEFSVGSLAVVLLDGELLPLFPNTRRPSFLPRGHATHRLTRWNEREICFVSFISGGNGNRPVAWCFSLGNGAASLLEVGSVVQGCAALAAVTKKWRERLAASGSPQGLWSPQAPFQVERVVGGVVVPQDSIQAEKRGVGSDCEEGERVGGDGHGVFRNRN